MKTLSALRIQRNRRRHYSQWGEDGVLDYILGRLPSRDKWLVEFGAWDGKHLSNGFYFLEKKNYTGVLIEMEQARFRELEKNMENFKTVCVHAAVGFEGDSKLDSILADTSIPKNFDLLSIDIDGNDYQVWQALNHYQPKVVIIEINASILPGEVVINNPDQDFVLWLSGSSVSALTQLAESKGYKLISNVGCNAIFVRSEYYGLFYSKPQSEYDLFTYEAFGKGQLNAAQNLSALLFAAFRPNITGRIFHVLKQKVKLLR